MSNFQRTRSKVWWGDSPPNIGSPVARQSEWNHANNRAAAEEPDWEPQLPHWVANGEQQRNNSADNIAQNNEPNQWPLRHGSPGSHKSQDSGFSDSDSSPPTSQYYPSPENNDSKTSKSSSDSNNNENITVKQVLDFQDTPKTGKDVVDNAKPTPKPRLRSTSVIQTPYDLQKYYEVHTDEEHINLLKDEPESSVNNTLPQSAKNSFSKKISSEKPNPPRNYENVSPKSNINRIGNVIEIKITPPYNLEDKENSPNIISTNNEAKEENTNVISPSKKYPTKKSFVSSKDHSNISKVAIVKDLDTGKNISDDSLEYIKLPDHNEIAVNNQPRVRTPISNVTYVPTERTQRDAKRADYRRSMATEKNIPIEAKPTFQRNRLNKSLNFEAQSLDQQILNIQDGHRSLGHIEEHTPSKDETFNHSSQIHQPSSAILGKNIMDSLNLRPAKKIGPKHRMVSKAEKLFLTKKEKPEVVDSHAGGILSGSRVPFLGLPRVAEHNSWVIVGHPEQELLIPSYNEILVGDESNNNTREKAPGNRLSCVTPPPQFQDNEKCNRKGGDLTHDSKKEKLKEYDINFGNAELHMTCTSTPKMLAPHEFMNKVASGSNSKIVRKTNLVDKFDGIILNNKNEILYRERSIDQTALERLCERKPEPVQYWLCELVGTSENECMTTLQSKPLGAEQKALMSSSSATITGNIKKVQTHGQIIVHQYSDVIRQLEDEIVNEEQICLLVANINEFVLAHSITLNSKPPGETPERWDKIKKTLQSYLQKLIDIGEDVKIELNETDPELKVVKKNLDMLIEIFLETTKAVLVQQLKTLVSIIEEPTSDLVLKSTLSSIGHLAMLNDPPQTSLHEKCCKIMKSISELPFVDCGVPRALLTAIIETNKSSVKALSLRGLATVCVTGDAVKQFEEGGGIEILSDILSDSSNPEPQMREAITVLTQITAPWLRGHYDLTQMHLYLDNIVKRITDILSRTECCQLLLLCTACLVNLVRELELEKKEGAAVGSDVVEVIERHRTVERLLDAVKRRGPSISVFLQEQTASLIASLSRVPRSLRPLSSLPGAAPALVSFTRTAPVHAPRQAELRAQARLHAHAAEGIARLCAVPDVSQQIIQLEGVSHLTRLVRMQRKRPHFDLNPDQTLIHCLKALRTIYRHHPEAFVDCQQDVDEMIRPHLMESLMMFSAKQESYV